MRRCALLAFFALGYAGYLLLGALVISAVERPYESRLRAELRELKAAFLDSSPCLPEAALERFLGAVLSANRHGVALLHNASAAPSNWDFASAFFFCSTLITTVGDAKVLPVRDRTDLQRPRVRVTLWKAASHCNRGHLHNHPSRLRLHHAAVGRREGLLPLLRAAGRALHHAGAHGHRATPGGRARRRPARAPGAEVGLPAAEPLLRAPAPAGRGGAGGLLPGARRRLQRPGGVLELPGRLLLLLHLPLHHRPGGLRPGRAAGPALPPSLQDLRHGWSGEAEESDVELCSRVRPRRAWAISLLWLSLVLGGGRGREEAAGPFSPSFASILCWLMTRPDCRFVAKRESKMPVLARSSLHATGGLLL
ncbi:uncharacterized protein LOC129343075 isoform X3 [Eublepharis macularius]|uniref:Uncharacterized protein LOC129343075 isoform X3 n=1 Tax=Eublepharis macularius TaxID=481883 RepID=A0AA97LGR1_EUBMA|nr:uncharacterized protein LOC129343075 isoform X3 [Eublepharis macularius]